MKKKIFKRRHITLIEMMIVMFLIAMITGVIAYNYSGSLEEGKAFKTKAGMEKIHTVIDLYLATHPDESEHINTIWQEVVEHSPLVKNHKELIKDGWGELYEVSTGEQGLVINSKKYNDYLTNRKGTLFNKDEKRT